MVGSWRNHGGPGRPTRYRHPDGGHGAGPYRHHVIPSRGPVWIGVRRRWRLLSVDGEWTGARDAHWDPARHEGLSLVGTKDISEDTIAAGWAGAARDPDGVRETRPGNDQGTASARGGLPPALVGGIGHARTAANPTAPCSRTHRQRAPAPGTTPLRSVIVRDAAVADGSLPELLDMTRERNRPSDGIERTGNAGGT